MLIMSILAVEDDRVEARQSMLDAYPSLKKMYAVDDGKSDRETDERRESGEKGKILVYDVEREYFA